MVRIQSIQIASIGPIKNLSLSFDNSFNIICGQNGIGKTTILDCLSQSFGINNTSVKKAANSTAGSWNISAVINGSRVNRLFNVRGFHPNENQYDSQGFYENGKDVIVFKTHRDIPYSQLSSINVDTQKDIHSFARDTVQGTLPNDLKNWFVSRHLWSKHENHLNETQLKNIDLAKKCFNLLNSEVAFSRVNPASNDILINTPVGEIYFEYLSSGYKSCMAVLIGIIKEIEFRYKDPGLFIGDFSGIIFIDEIDLHLHPEWQAKIYVSLKEVLPNAQIFTTTHSPHIIQVANSKEIIPLVRDENNDVKLNELVNKEYGCQGWTVEEILKDVMGMSETRTQFYTELVSKFNFYLDNEDFDSAVKCFNVLDKVLHPDNSLRKVLRIQLVGISEND